MSEKATGCFDLTVWLNRPEWPIPHGFRRGDSEDRNTLRIGPLCIAWSFERYLNLD